MHGTSQTWAVTLKVNPARLQIEDDGLDIGYINTRVNLDSHEDEFKTQSTAIILTTGEADKTNVEMMSLIRGNILKVLNYEP